MDTHTAGGENSNPLVRKLSALMHLSAEEIDFLTGLQINLAELDGEKDFVVEGDEYRSSFIVLSGWAFRYRVLEQGRRQIISVVLPGDFVGLNVNFRRTATFSVATKTPCTLALVEPMRILEIHQKFPVLASALNWVTVREYSILAEQVVRLGRRTAYERMVHLLLELYHRLTLIGMAEDERFRLPVTQNDIGDILGLSDVHVHRTLRRLVGDGMITKQASHIVLCDVDRLTEIADSPEAFLEDFAVL